MMQRIHKIKTNYSVRDYYDYYRKTYDKEFDRGLYSKITKEFNSGVVDLIIEEGLIFTLPKLNFKILIKKTKRKAYIKKGKLVNSVPIDWKRTNALWERDQEAKDKKIRVRYNNSHSSGFVFRVSCDKSTSKLRNKTLFKFKTCRKFQRNLSARILDKDKDNFDAYLLY